MAELLKCPLCKNRVEVLFPVKVFHDPNFNYGDIAPECPTARTVEICSKCFKQKMGKENHDVGF